MRHVLSPLLVALLLLFADAAHADHRTLEQSVDQRYCEDCGQVEAHYSFQVLYFEYRIDSWGNRRVFYLYIRYEYECIDCQDTSVGRRQWINRWAAHR